MANQELGLMAHLMRRAGCGATRDELETCIQRGYEATVDELLHPEQAPEMDEDLLGMCWILAQPKARLRHKEPVTRSLPLADRDSQRWREPRTVG